VVKKLEAFLKIFGNITILQVIEFSLAIAFLVICFIKFVKFVNKKHDAEQQRTEDIQEALEGARSVPKCQEHSKLVHKELKTEIANVHDNLEDKILQLEQKVDTKIDGLQDTLDDIMKHLKEIDDDRKKRERNRAREELLQGHRMFCDIDKNPMKAWSQLEHDSWFSRYDDYIDCGGNGDMQRRIYPDMCDLIIIHMDDEQKLYDLMRSRKL
jgi:hypothetical protein